MEDNAELESFRRQWREEVARRSKPTGSVSVPDAAPRSAAPIASPALLTATRPPPTRHAATDRKDLEQEEPAPASFDPEELAQQVGELKFSQEEGDEEEDGFTRRAQQEPNSALEHFERAVEKEAAGNLGDSLQHYRKAYRVSIWMAVNGDKNAANANCSLAGCRCRQGLSQQTFCPRLEKARPSCPS